MENGQKMDLIKKLENLVAFQKDCLISGDWEDYDKAVEEVKRLEKEIVCE